MNRTALLLAPLLAGLWCCAEDRSAGGTGTETGSAVAARFVSAEGKPASHALVEARPSGSTGREFRSARTDDSGKVAFRLEDGDWTLVAYGTGTGAKLDFQLRGSDLTLPAAILRPTSSVSICPLPGSVSGRLALRGTGWESRLGPDGCARFDTLPYGRYVVDDGSGSLWCFFLEARVRDSLFQVSGRQHAWFRFGRNARWEGSQGAPRLVDLPGGKLDSFPEEWFGADGTPVPEVLVWERGDGSRRSWIQPRTTGLWISRRRVWGAAPTGNFLPNAGATGVWSVSMGVRDGRLTSLPDLSGGASLPFSTTDSFGLDPAQGWYLSTLQGAPRLVLDSTRLPAQGDFAFLIHVRSPSRSGNVFRWKGSTGTTGLSLDAVPEGYRLLAPGVDSTIDLMNVSNFHSVALSYRADTLHVGVDGISRLSLPCRIPERRDWAPAEIGTGQGLWLTQIATFRSGVDISTFSSPPGKLSIE